MQKENFNLFLLLESEGKINDKWPIAYAELNLNSKEVSNCHFGHEIRANGIHAETNEILNAAVKQFNVACEKVVITISQEDWLKYLETKNLGILENNTKQIYKSLDSYEFRPGVYFDYTITKVKHFLKTGVNEAIQISPDLAKMLDLIELEKLPKLKTDELDMDEYLKFLSKGNNIIVTTDISYKVQNSNQEFSLPFLDFIRLNKN